MAQSAVIAAVAEGLTGWTHTPVVGLNEETEDTLLPRFVEPSFPLSRNHRIAVSDRAYREEGMVRLLLAVERGIGLLRPSQWADELARLFNDKTIGGVVFKTANTPQFDDTNDEGSYFVINVLIPYSYEYRED